MCSVDAYAEPVLHVDRLRKSYHLGDKTLGVLEGLSLKVHCGEIVAVMGPSGSGKTTLLNCISAIDAPDSGQVWVAGNRVDYESELQRTLLRRHRIGMVFQFFNLLPTLTVRENVALPYLIAGRWDSSANARVDQILDEVGMTQRRDHHPFQLSGGEMQLVSIARALVRRPDMLLADEPTGNVNPRIGRTIMEILRNSAIHERVGTLMVTHSPEHAAWADRICFLKDGVIAAEHEQQGRHEEVVSIHDQLMALEI